MLDLNVVYNQLIINQLYLLLEQISFIKRFMIADREEWKNRLLQDLIQNGHSKCLVIIMFIITVVGTLSTDCSGQEDTVAFDIYVDSIMINSTRISRSWAQSTRAVTAIDKPGFNLSQQNSLQESLNGVAGVFSLNAYNLAQDLRISIRGAGSRSSFGVRGVKVIVDGIPETTPDGQTQLDAIPIGAIDRIEIIKGPPSVLYGNASGGVISISTLNQFEDSPEVGQFLNGRILYGSYNYSQAQVSYGKDFGPTSFIILGDHSQSDGFRSNSGFTSSILKGRFDHRFSKFSKISVFADFLASPKANDAGGLTLDESTQNRRQARVNNLDFNSGESVRNFKTSVQYSLLATDDNVLDIYGFYTRRIFDGLLPFLNGGAIDLNRHYFGQGISYTVKNKRGLTVKYGYDIASQLDGRQRFVNDAGTRGDLTLNQREIFKHAGIYTLAEVELGALVISPGLRYDYHELRVRDDLSSNDAGSGEQRYNVFNPSFGINFRAAQNINLFANYSTSFDTPTLNELSNNPTGATGFNADLEPQQSVSFELGARLDIVEKLRAQATLFRIKTDNELVPFQQEGFPGQTFFRNVGQTLRQGLELEGSYTFNPSLSATLSYTFSDFTYDEFELDGEAFDGNYLPGLPKHNLAWGLEYIHESGLSVTSSNSLIGSIYLDDANSSNTDKYLLSNINVSYVIEKAKIKITPFLGLNNILDAEYNDNIRINAFGGRFFEPAPGFNLFGGVAFQF